MKEKGRSQYQMKKAGMIPYQYGVCMHTCMYTTYEQIYTYIQNRSSNLSVQNIHLHQNQGSHLKRSAGGGGPEIFIFKSTSGNSNEVNRELYFEALIQKDVHQNVKNGSLSMVVRLEEEGELKGEKVEKDYPYFLILL